nr:response regulator transcription factor [Kitasatospora viridis]
MRLSETPTEAARVTVEVLAPDPISRVGATSQLRQYPEVSVVEAGGPDGGATVRILLVESLDGESMAQLRRLVRGGAAKVVLVVGRIREPELMEAVECGVNAILWRNEATPERLRRAVLAAARGQGDLPADLLGRLLSQVGRLQRGGGEGAPGDPGGLTARETEILRLVAEGLDTAEIGARIGYSQRTVKNVLYGVTNRLRLRNRAHAVAYALREGYI